MARRSMAQIRRREISDALYRCIVKRGYADTSIRDIAREALVRSGLIHHYFESKEEILSQMTEETFKSYWERFVLFSRKQQKKPRRERLRARIQFIFLKVAGDRDLIKVFHELWNLSQHDERLNKSLRRLYRNYRETVAKMIAESLGESEPRQKATKHLAAFLVSASEGASIQWFIDPRAISLTKLSELANQLVDVVLEGEDPENN